MSSPFYNQGMTYLVEQPLPLIFTGVVITLALVAMGWPNRNRLVLTIAAIAGVLTALLWFAGQAIVTPKEEVATTLHQVAMDMEANDLAKILGHFASNSNDLTSEAERWLKRISFQSVSVKRNLEVSFKDAAETQAVASFNAAARVKDKSGQWQNQMVARYFVVQFEKQNGRWLVVNYEHRDPIKGKD